MELVYQIVAFAVFAAVAFTMYYKAKPNSKLSRWIRKNIVWKIEDKFDSIKKTFGDFR